MQNAVLARKASNGQMIASIAVEEIRQHSLNAGDNNKYRCQPKSMADDCIQIGFHSRKLRFNPAFLPLTPIQHSAKNNSFNDTL
jgi:hypothetical protein